MWLLDSTIVMFVVAWKLHTNREREREDIKKKKKKKKKKNIYIYIYIYNGEFYAKGIEIFSSATSEIRTN